MLKEGARGIRGTAKTQPRLLILAFVPRTGVGSRRSVGARIEQGRHDPSLSTLERLAKALGTKLSALVD